MQPERVENPATGESYVFLGSVRDDRGSVFKLERYQKPGGFVPEHVHPHQEERFVCLEGSMTFRIRGKDELINAGEVMLIPAGVGHSLRNEGDTEAKAYIELRPALATREMFETYAALARDGKTTKRGIPRNPVQLVAVAEHHHEVITLPRPPLFLQRLLLRPLAVLARLFGVSGVYPRPARRAAA